MSANVQERMARRSVPPATFVGCVRRKIRKNDVARIDLLDHIYNLAARSLQREEIRNRFRL